MNSRLFFIIAIVAFLLDLVLVFVSGIDHKLVDALLFGGLAALAAGHSL